MATITTINGSDVPSASRAVINSNFAALQNLFAGGTEPSAMVAFQLWLDTSTTPDTLKMRNAANSAWVTIIPDVTATAGGMLALTGGTMSGAIAMGTSKITGLGSATAAADAVAKTQIDSTILVTGHGFVGIAAGTTYELLFVAPAAGTVISDVKIISDTATTGSDGSNNYTFQVANVTQTLNLRSAAKSTNGAEIAANTIYALALDQNLTITTSDVLRLVMVKTGSPTSLATAKIIAQVNWKVTL